MPVGVYRAPMRSRRNDVDVRATIDRALAVGLCGLGGVLDPAPHSLDEAIDFVARQHEDRLARRVERFAAVPDGSFVWTRDDDLLFWLGKLDGPWSYDPSDAAARVDLVHVRRCAWGDSPVVEHHAPAAVLATFGRGGRNFQRINDATACPATQQIWATRTA